MQVVFSKHLRRVESSRFPPRDFRGVIACDVVDDQIWLISFLGYVSGYFDLDCGVRHLSVCDDAVNRIAPATM